MANNTFSLSDLGVVAPASSQSPEEARARRRGLSKPGATTTSTKKGRLPEDPGLLDTIKAAAERYGVPLEYGLALAQQESEYNPQARNSEFGAAGLFQYIPETAKARGIDPLNPEQSADAAMRDFAEAAKDKGIDWAIKHHFAGPNVAGHGPKTRQYLADVQKRAEDIRALLGGKTSGVGGSTEEGPKQVVGDSDTFSLADLQGMEIADPAMTGQEVNAKPKVPEDDSTFLERTGGAIKDAAVRGFDYVMQRIQDKPGEYLGQEKVVVERTPEEIEAIIKAADEPFAFGLGYSAGPILGRDAWKERERERLRFTGIYRESAENERDRILADKAEREKPQLPGFMANVKNPAKLILNDSLPANFLEALAKAPAHQRKAFMDARRVYQQEFIVANASKFPSVAVEAAQQAIDARAAKQDPTIRQMWHDLKTAAMEDPGRFGAQFANALMADPELLVAPAGLGTRVLATTKGVVTGSTQVSRVTRIADKVLDAGSVEAALNVGIEAAQSASVGDEFTAKEAAQAAAIGAAIGGPLGAIFARGAEARVKLRNKNAGELSPEDLEAAMRAAAQEDLAAEQVVENPESIPTKTRERIETVLGITHMSQAERKKWHQRRQRELRATFEEHSSEADYLAFKAEERILRTEQLAAERAEADARSQAQAAAAKESSVDAAWAQHEAGRLAGLREEYDAALQARQDAAMADPKSAEAAEARINEITNKLDEEEIISAAFEGAPQVRRAMGRALQRDAQLRRPKWQRGEVDPKLLARVGIGGLFAGTALAVAPEDKKVESAFAAGLAGLMIPGGGSVLRRMRQSGAVSMDGTIPGLAELVKKGKLKPDVEIETAKAREVELVNRAKQGDQKAFQELYEEHVPRLTRYLRRFSAEEAEDLAQETFVRFFRNIESYDPSKSGVYTFLQNVGRREGIRAIESANTLKRGREFATESIDQVDDDVSNLSTEMEVASADIESPEYKALYDESQKRLLAAIKGLPETQQTIFLLNKVEDLTAREIAERFEMPLNTVLSHLKRATDSVLELVEKDFNAKKLPRKSATTASVENLPASEIDPNTGRRRRGRPRKQAGEIDPRLLKVGGVAALGAGAGAYLNEKNRELGALTGALMLPAALMLKGKSGKTATQHITNVADYTLGITSTRLKNIAEPVWRKAIELERFILRDTHKHLSNVAPFLRDLKAMKPETRDILTRAILTGDARVTDNLLKAINDPKITANWKAVRSTLDSLADQLVHLKRFSKGQFEYFPRMVKDVPGLLKALGRERASFIEDALKDANEKSIRNRGTGLTELEESAIVNKILSTDAHKSSQPGYAKNRGVEEITPELQKFYHTPAESLHSYIRSAVEDIERAKFFGKDLEVITKDGKQYTNVDASVGNIINRLIKEEKVTPEQAEEVGSLMKSRFTSGEKVPHELIQHGKNLAYAGLLGNPFSAAVQLGDVIIQSFTQDTRSVMYALAQKLGGKKKVSMKDFGLADHIAEEFTSTTKSAKALRFIMATALFRGVDHFGKDIALNAAIIRHARLARSERGIREIQRKYGEALTPGELDQLVKDLQKGEPTDLVRSIAFAELSRTQPITRLEMPQAYLDHPNGRVAYMLKTFMLKQIDLARREGWNEFRKGNYARGIRNLTELGIVMGLAGTSTDVIKDFLLGKEVELEASDIASNALKTFGLSKYFLDQFLGVSKEEAAERRAAGETFVRKRDAQPLQAIGAQAVPPAKMFDQIVTGDPAAIRYIPWVGPYLYEQYKAEQEKKR